MQDVAFVTGGLPAYASSLTLQIDKNLKCWFEAVYPRSIPGEELAWKVTKKAFNMKGDDFQVGVGLLGWVSVEFEESCAIGGNVKSRNHKIEAPLFR